MEDNERQSGKIEGAIVVLILVFIGLIICLEPMKPRENTGKRISESWPMSQEEFSSTRNGSPP